MRRLRGFSQRGPPLRASRPQPPHFTRPRALAFFARAGWDTLGAKLRRIPTAGELHDDRWPTHLHINVEPRARGTGAAQALMDSWLERLAAAGSPGCYLQTLRENHRATAFFVHQGFVAYGEEVLVPGVRYLDRQVHQVTMVRPAPGTPTAAD
jgi:GNAT superfamily N-acetyltransferase